MIAPEPSTLDHVRLVAAAPFLAAATLLAVGYTVAVQVAELVGGITPRCAT